MFIRRSKPSRSSGNCLENSESLKGREGSSPSFSAIFRVELMFNHVKFKNTKENRKCLLERGYIIHDPHHTFNRKSWIIFSEETPRYLLGVEKRHKRREVTILEFDKLIQEDFLTRFVTHPRILDLSIEDKEVINLILDKY